MQMCDVGGHFDPPPPSYAIYGVPSQRLTLRHSLDLLMNSLVILIVVLIAKNFVYSVLEERI